MEAPQELHRFDAHSKDMNTTRTSRFSSIRNLGRGIAVASSVAVMGVTSMSAADAQAAGIASGVRHANTATEVVKPAPTSLVMTNNSRYVLRDGKVFRRA